jgi:RimJ/RimL family protein N-acetyltransferase
MTIKTERLEITPLSLHHKEDMFNYAKSDIYEHTAGWKAHKDINETETVIKMLIKLGNQYSIIYNKKMIGTIGLDFKDDEVTFGYALSEAYWNKGIMSEALRALIIYLFTETKCETLKATTFLNNYNSQNLLLKLGFKFIKVINELRDNKYTEFNLYELKKEEYERKSLPWQNMTTRK